MAALTQLPALFLMLTVSAVKPDSSLKDTSNPVIEIIIVAPFFQMIPEGFTSFNYGNQSIQVWNQTHPTADTELHFSYTPICVPMGDENRTVIVNVEGSGTNWITYFDVILDDEKARDLAFYSVQIALRKDIGVHRKNVLAYPLGSPLRPLKSLKLELPDFVEHYFRANNMRLSNEVFLNESATIVRVKISSPTSELAKDISRTLQNSRLSFDIRPFSADGRKKKIDNLFKNLKLMEADLQEISQQVKASVGSSVGGEKNPQENREQRCLVPAKLLSSKVDSLSNSVSNDLEEIVTFLEDVDQRFSRSSDGKVCEKSWRKVCTFGSCNCYKVFSSKASWKAAGKRCKDFGANLASIHNADEAQVIQKLVIAAGDTDTWIGLNDRAVEGKFEWSDGTETSYSAWKKGQPDDVKGDEDCANIIPRASYGWSDDNCLVPLMSACKKKI